jgi:methylmalonyl-CoA/ethylmalonyl-CoA epimerase
MAHKINHIAIAVRDIEASKSLFALVSGAKVGATIEVPDQRVKVCFIETGETRIELIEPLPGNVGVAKFLEKRGEGLHHICIGVDDIDAVLADYKSRGVRLIDETPRIGAEGHRVAFVHPQSTNGVLVELEESGEVS